MELGFWKIIVCTQEKLILFSITLWGKEINDSLPLFVHVLFLSVDILWAQVVFGQSNSVHNLYFMDMLKEYQFYTKLSCNHIKKYFYTNKYLNYILI